MQGDMIAAASEGLGRTERLRARKDYLRVQGTGRRVQTRHFLLMVAPTGIGRFGVTVTKRIGNAVRRNRVKRVVREVLRRNRELFPAACEIVVIARRGAADLGYDGARQEFAAVRDRLRRAAHNGETATRPVAAGPRGEQP